MPVAPGAVTLYGADGAPVEELRHDVFTDEDLAVLVAYKKFLAKHQYREALYCQRCWEHDLSDGVSEAYVRTSGMTVEAMFKCRCRVGYGKGVIA